MPPLEIYNPERRKLYRCDHCEKIAPWDDGWAWYGSYKQLEDFGLKNVQAVITMCSNDCRIALVAQGRIPSEGLDDHGAVVEAA